jgi:hypothetical protein
MAVFREPLMVVYLENVLAIRTGKVTDTFSLLFLFFSLPACCSSCFGPAYPKELTTTHHMLAQLNTGVMPTPMEPTHHSLSRGVAKRTSAVTPAPSTPAPIPHRTV